MMPKHPHGWKRLSLIVSVGLIPLTSLAGCNHSSSGTPAPNIAPANPEFERYVTVRLDPNPTVQRLQLIKALNVCNVEKAALGKEIRTIAELTGAGR